MTEVLKIPRTGLNRLGWVRSLLTGSRRWFYRRVCGMDVHPTVEMSLSAKLDMTFPKGIHIGEYSYLAFESKVLTHDRTRGLYVDTVIGKNCFIGGRSMILPGVTVGDGSIVGAGAVVTKDVQPGTIVAGNPAKVIRENVDTLAYGRLREADATESEIASRAFDQGSMGTVSEG